MRPDLRTLTFSLAIMLMLGWLLRVGQVVLLPVIIAMISLYVLASATNAIARIPVVGLLPTAVRRTIVLIAFTIGVVALFVYVINTFATVVNALPKYEENLDRLVLETAALVGIEDQPSWSSFYDATIGRFEIQSIVPVLLTSLRGFGGTLFLVVLYAAFLMAERLDLTGKLALALGDAEKQTRTVALLERINTRVGEYLSVKTLVNVILGALSYAIMLALGIEFALFWAILIGMLNYIPYIGSMIGVVFPVLLSLAQFGSLYMGAGVLVALTIAQLFVAGFLEPRMMSRAFNLSPFVVLLALAFWGALWGVSGAVLAVPLTATLVIVLAEIEATRPIAIMLSGSGKV
ncbi:AI-2E family transporter [Maritimibacter sp. DP1N21-5]|uniref:AI-2E family transporter n=1 Tax=Maritimibacter sp. DP1N21-5 TaxID=2836867 RepID=UPI001C44482F|nr:AI-2E family transporter [Maritimibacter sp. DP1N21-5]MBV7410741.1 AI-2E family transporter [Maritimibacter sp. DP1N21-5]